MKCRSTPERPSGGRFGALVHAILADVDLQSAPEAIWVAAEIYGRLVDATEEQAAAPCYIRLWGGRRVRPITTGFAARHPSCCSAPTALSPRAPLTSLREETADFNGWTVVDFKAGGENAVRDWRCRRVRCARVLREAQD